MFMAKSVEAALPTFKKLQPLARIAKNTTFTFSFAGTGFTVTWVKSGDKVSAVIKSLEGAVEDGEMTFHEIASLLMEFPPDRIDASFGIECMGGKVQQKFTVEKKDGEEVVEFLKELALY